MILRMLIPLILKNDPILQAKIFRYRMHSINEPSKE